MLAKIYPLVPLVFEDCQSAAHLHQKVFFKGWKENDFREFLENPLIFSLKVEKDHELIGYIMWREVKDEAELLTLVVSTPYQNKGIGSVLLGRCITILKEKHILNVFLEVAEDNHVAKSFYIKHDFILLSKRPHYYPRPGKKKISALNFFKKLV
ncbi:MAG: GNAT family N-acetyltransferase [Proteobacteria bacterium]|nr:GNAT family N-acetyltransferase [Pseudomonadota bacterium]